MNNKRLRLLINRPRPLLKRKSHKNAKNAKEMKTEMLFCLHLAAFTVHHTQPFGCGHNAAHRAHTRHVLSPLIGTCR